MLKLSVLDQSAAAQGRPQAAAVQETLAVAEACEALGYHRFWLSEHHDNDAIVGTAPEVLIAAVAARTRRMRVGSAGVLLSHYAPFKVAEQFRVLEAIAPGRIDLGIGRAPGAGGPSSVALNPLAGPESPQAFLDKVADLIAWTEGEGPPPGRPGAGARAFPTGPTSAETWLLGSSTTSAQLAAMLGRPFCFAWFIREGRGAQEALDLYRRLYRPSPRHPEPYAALCVWALAADTAAEADRLFQTREHWRTVRDEGARLSLLPPEEAAAYPYSPEQRLRLRELREGYVVGDADFAAERLDRIARDTGVQEIAVVTWAYDPEARLRSYALLADRFGLARAVSPAST